MFFIRAMVRIFSSGERWNVPLNETIAQLNETFHLPPNENILTIARIKSFIICFISNSLNFGAQVAQNVPLDQFFGKFIKTICFKRI